MCGLHLDEWQQHVLERGLGTRDDGVWAASHVGLVVARQNGKGAVLLARELAGALLFGEKTIIHSAHEAETARNHMQEWLDLIDSSPLLSSKVAKTPMGRGSEAVVFKNGARIRFRTRTRGGGRGLSVDLVVVDEAFEYSVDAMSALEPTTSSSENPQIWLASSAVDQVSHPNGLVFSQRRKQALSDAPGRLCWQEWSPADGYDPADRDVWAATNPALGIRISEEHVAGEFSAMPTRMFAVERLSDGDWPDPDAPKDEARVSLTKWVSLESSEKMVPPFVFGVDVATDQTRAAISVAGWTEQGKLKVELVCVDSKSSWVHGKLAQLVEDHSPLLVAHDAFVDLGDLDCETRAAGFAEMKEAHGMFLRAFDERELLHSGDNGFSSDVRNLEMRTLSGGVLFKSRHVSLRSAVLACWGLTVGVENETADPFVFVQ